MAGGPEADPARDPGCLHPGGARIGGGACGRPGASRLQAVERHDRRPRASAGARLRTGAPGRERRRQRRRAGVPAGGDGRAHAHRGNRRDAGVHGSRAVRRRRGGRADGSVQLLRGAVRGAVRGSAVLGRHDRGACGADPGRRHRPGSRPATDLEAAARGGAPRAEGEAGGPAPVERMRCCTSWRRCERAGGGALP